MGKFNLELSDIRVKKTNIRPVRCINIEEKVKDEGHLLKINGIYNLLEIRKVDGNVFIFFAEIPEKGFLSIRFQEVVPYFHINGMGLNYIKDLNIGNLPVVLLAETCSLDLQKFTTKINMIQLEKMFSVGTSSDCDVVVVAGAGDTVSRYHFFIAKDYYGNLSLYDCSLRGTRCLTAEDELDVLSLSVERH